MKHTANAIKIGTLHSEETHVIRAPLYFNQASFDDDLFDPLSHGEKIHEYLSFDPEKLIFETFGSKSLKFEIIFGLNEMLKYC